MQTDLTPAVRHSQSDEHLMCPEPRRHDSMIYGLTTCLLVSTSKHFISAFQYYQDIIHANCQQINYMIIVFYGCESRSLILREQRLLKVSKDRALRKILG